MDGFLPFSRGTLMIDVVVTAMAVVVPGVLCGRFLARTRRYARHRQVQLALAAALAVIVLAFEVEVRTAGWQNRAEASPYFTTYVFPFLYVHIALACTATACWILATYHGLTRMPRPAAPGPHSSWHKKIGNATVYATCATALTGWIFFYLAFVAT